MICRRRNAAFLLDGFGILLAGVRRLILGGNLKVALVLGVICIRVKGFFFGLFPIFLLDKEVEAADGEVLRFGILTYRLDLAQLIRSCTLEILNANGCIVDEMNLDSAIPMNWKEAVPEDEITKFKEETGNEYGVQIDSIPEFKPRKKFVRKDG